MAHQPSAHVYYVPPSLTRGLAAALTRLHFPSPVALEQPSQHPCAQVCFAFFLMLGTIGWRASLLFVRHIYRSIKCE